MKNNVINPQFGSIQFGDNGSIEIIGVTGNSHCAGNSVLILVKGAELSWFGLCFPDFCKNRITSWAPDEPKTMIMVFQFSIEGELRNPRRLLKSIRNRVIGTINAKIAEVETDEDKLIAKEMHRGLTLGEAVDHVMLHSNRNNPID